MILDSVIITIATGTLAAIAALYLFVELIRFISNPKRYIKQFNCDHNWCYSRSIFVGPKKTKYVCSKCRKVRWEKRPYRY